MLREFSGDSDSVLTLMEGKMEGSKCKKDLCDLMTLKSWTILDSDEKIKRVAKDRIMWRAVARQPSVTEKESDDDSNTACSVSDRDRGRCLKWGLDSFSSFSPSLPGQKRPRKTWRLGAI